MGIVYGFRTLNPRTLAEIELGYVGKTRQRLHTREYQHREEQPWADIIVGSAYIISESFWTDQELDHAETWAIQVLKPRYNIEKNHGNAYRATPEDAVQQRQARDRARGIPAWLPTAPPRLMRPAFRRARNSAPSASALPRDVHDGHRAVLAQMNVGLASPGRIAKAIGYSERQVHNLLVELKDHFGLVERAGHGKYGLVEVEP